MDKRNSEEYRELMKKHYNAEEKIKEQYPADMIDFFEKYLCEGDCGGNKVRENTLYSYVKDRTESYSTYIAAEYYADFEGEQQSDIDYKKRNMDFCTKINNLIAKYNVLPMDMCVLDFLLNKYNTVTEGRKNSIGGIFRCAWDGKELSEALKEFEKYLWNGKTLPSKEAKRFMNDYRDYLNRAKKATKHNPKYNEDCYNILKNGLKEFERRNRPHRKIRGIEKNGLAAKISGAAVAGIGMGAAWVNDVGGVKTLATNLLDPIVQKATPVVSQLQTIGNNLIHNVNQFANTHDIKTLAAVAALSVASGVGGFAIGRKTTKKSQPNTYNER